MYIKQPTKNNELVHFQTFKKMNKCHYARESKYDFANVFGTETKRLMIENPGHCDYGIDAIKFEYELLSKTPEERKRHLQSLMVERIRDDSTLCALYISGISCKLAKHVAAIMRITSFLFSHGHTCWSLNKDKLERRLLNYVRSGKYTFNDAVEKACLLKLTDHRYNYNDYCDYDYDL